MPSKKILVQQDYLFVPTGSIPASGSVAFYPKSDNSFYKRTAAGVESKLWDNDNHGIGSGLNADLLDGNHASAFAPASHNHSLGSLSDVSIVSPFSGQTLRFNGTSWANTDNIAVFAAGYSYRILLQSRESTLDHGDADIEIDPETGIFFRIFLNTANYTQMVLNAAGLSVGTLSGTGERYLAADANGVIKVASIQPSALWESDSYNLSPIVNSGIYPNVNIGPASYFGAQAYLNEYRGATLHLKGHELDIREQEYFLTADRNVGVIAFEANNEGIYYRGTASVLAKTTQDHSNIAAGTQLEFWTTANNTTSGYQRMVIRQDGKVVGINGFGVFGADGMSGTSTFLTHCTYDAGKKSLEFTRVSVTFNGGIATVVNSISNLVVTL